VEAVVKFWIVAVFGWVVNGAVLALATDGLGLPVVPGQLAATGVVFFLSFGLNRIWTFA
ncbi:MAG TPA: GtrA family protein, partial [Chromatiales bacterium]|nr:GtrA family protein [Chromatiales bacterium]